MMEFHGNNDGHCLAALTADPRPCEGRLAEVRVVDRTGRGTTACRLHGAVLVASLEDARVYPLDGGHTAAAAVYRWAVHLRPFDGVWTGPGVGRVRTLDEIAAFPSVPDPKPDLADPRCRSSRPGNAPPARSVAGRPYQAGGPGRRR